MSRVLDLLLSGGAFNQRLAAVLHSAVWARRLRHGNSDVPEMSLLDDLDLRGRIALDVGAHSGNWAVHLAGRVGTEGAVFAYEALPHYGRALKGALRLLRVSNVHVRPVAIGNAQGEIALRRRSADTQLLTSKTRIEPDATPSSGVTEVPVTTLDQDLFTRGVRLSDVAFVKIDVEGAELDVLRGSYTLLKKGRPVVYLETEPEWAERLGHSVPEVFTEMNNHRYSPYLLTPAGAIPTDVDSYLKQYRARRAYNNVLFLPHAKL